MVEVSIAGLRALLRRTSAGKKISLMVAVLIVTVAVGLGDNPMPEGELRGGIAATTITDFTVTPSTAYVGEAVTFTASASSTTSSQLTFTFFYDAYDYPYPTNNTESPYTTHTTSSPGTVTTSFTYTRLGNLTSGSISYYIVRLFVGDGSNTVSTQKSINVIENTAPRFDDSLPTSLTLDPDEVADFYITVSDPDDDPVTVTWDFGDGADAINETGNALAGIDVSQSHAWSPDVGPGMGPVLYYYLVVTLEDPHSNTVSAIVEIGIRLPDNGLPVVYFDVSSNNVDPDVEDEVTFNASARDPEGEALTWTFVVNNSVEDVDVIVSHTDVTSANTTVWNNLTYAFSSPGTYNVRLYVSDALIPYQISPHNVTKVEYVFVTENAAPSVLDEIDVSDEAPLINVDVGYVVVTFMTQVYDADGDALTMTWGMADGITRTNTSDGGLMIYTFYQDRVFNATGSYNISVTVTDGYIGHDVTVYRLVNVISNNLPPAILEFSFTYGMGDFALPGESILFTLALVDPENDTLDVIWDFGDNTSLVYFNLTEYVDGVVTCVVNHAYYEVGVYNLTIDYTDNQLGILMHDKVKFCSIVVDGNAPPTIDVPDFPDVVTDESYDFSVTSSDLESDPIRYTWDWGDGMVSVTDTETASHTYDVQGHYTLTVYADDQVDVGGHNVSDIGEVTVMSTDNTAPVVVSFEVDDTAPYTGQEVSFTAVATDAEGDALRFTFAFGDGTYAVEDSAVTAPEIDVTFTVEHAYTVSDEYVCMVYVDDGYGHNVTEAGVITVSSESANLPPVANAGPDQTVDVGAEVMFDGSGSSDDVGVVNYTWTFSYDGSARTLYGVSPEFTFEVAGEYKVTLTVKDYEGQTDKDYVTVAVDEDKSFVGEYGLYVGVLVVVFIVAAAALVLHGRKGGKVP